MFRKMIVSTVLALTAITGVSLTASDASAHPTVPHRHDRRDHDHRHHVRFEVLYRHRHHWDSYGSYRDRDDAERAARRLRREGHDVRIEVSRW